MFRITTLAVALGAFALAAPAARAADHNEHFMQCAKACDDCGRTCDACSAHCLKLVAEGKKEHLKTLQLCQDCATACRASSSIVARQGPCSGMICTACADCCKMCAEACEKFTDDPTMKHCAEECRKCEKSCREMLKHLEHGEKK